MKKCTYCGRTFKREYETCLGCGASKFKIINNQYNYVITTPPKDGYKINFNNLKKLKMKVQKNIIILTVIFIILEFIILNIHYVSYIEEKTNSNLGYLVIIILIYIMALIKEIIKMINLNKKINGIKKLTKTGTLIKNMEYVICNSKKLINGKIKVELKINYITKTGLEVPFTSEFNVESKKIKENNTIDLLFDPNDYTNYFMDFEIY